MTPGLCWNWNWNGITWIPFQIEQPTVDIGIQVCHLARQCGKSTAAPPILILVLSSTWSHIRVRETYQPYITEDNIPAVKIVKSVYNITRKRNWCPIGEKELGIFIYLLCLSSIKFGSSDGMVALCERLYVGTRDIPPVPTLQEMGWRKTRWGLVVEVEFVSWITYNNTRILFAVASALHGPLLCLLLLWTW